MSVIKPKPLFRKIYNGLKQLIRIKHCGCSCAYGSHRFQLDGALGNDLFSLLPLGDVLVRTIIADDSSVLVALNMNLYRDITHAPICKENAVLQFRTVMPICGCKRPFNLLANNWHILRIDEQTSIVR